MSWTAQLEKGKTDTLLTAYSYDTHGNVKSLLQQIPGLAPKITSYGYDQISGNVNYVFYQPETAEQLIHRYRYDADNRIETVQTSTDGYVWSTDATYYYYPHGPLARVELGEHKVQGLDYYYTLQGWLKGVNMPGGGDPGADGIGTKRTGKDAMAFALGYFSGDYAPITAGTVLTDTRDALWTRTSTLNTNTGLYNGNITWMNTELAGSQDQYDMQAMVYKYDQLHRIVQARSLRAYTSGTGFTTRAATNSLAYDAGYTYDGNGNLLTLQRRNAAAAIQDNFAYGYYANSNKLRQTASAQGDNYTYDALGNLTKDVAAGVTNIEWTPSGKVRKVTKSTGSPLEFRYDAAGNRVEKKQGTTITRYVRDASGNVMAVYQADTISERPIYGSSRLGNLSYASKPGYRTVGHKQYELSNHLGNVLAVVSDRIRMKTDSTWTQVLSRTDYYPFGLEMTGRTESGVYRFGYNTQESVDEISGVKNHYTAPFWEYNPRIVTRWNRDPVTYPWQSPYAINNNNPIIYSDLLGLFGSRKEAKEHKRDNNMQGRIRLNQDRTYSIDDRKAGTSTWDDKEFGISTGILVEAKRSDSKTMTPFGVGKEWLSGTGARSREFNSGDLITNMYQQHEHVEKSKQMAINQLAQSGGQNVTDISNPYALGGIEGVGKYVKDYSTLATGGMTGNLIYTYLGSHSLTMSISNVDVENRIATVIYLVHNTSTMQSATRPPLIGYQEWYQNSVGKATDKLFKSGPGSETEQWIEWSETIKW